MSQKKEIICDIAILIFVELFILSFFNLSLIFKDTILSGGDSASHYSTLNYLSNILLPSERIIGWDPGNFAGNPLFQFYFPVPFLLAAFLGIAIPLTVALKIVTLLGIFSLPVFTYLCFRKLNYAFPIPVIASVFTTAFLLNESYTMWGGNVLSTFAGEFCYSISLSIFVLYIGSLYEGIKKNQNHITNALLLSLCGLSHAIPFMVLLTIPLFFLIRKEKFKENLKYLFKVNFLAFLLMGFWVIPMLAKLKFTTPIYMIWNFSSIKDLIPPLLIPFFILSLIRPLLLFIFKESDKSDKFYYFSYIILVSILFFINSHLLVVPDIRFLPILYLVLVFISTDLLGLIIPYIKPKIILAFLLFIGTVFFVNPNVKDARSWFKWNYEGYEGKSTWQTFSKINQFIKGTYQDPRVAYEKSPVINAFGSDRAFESIPLFAGRQTLEGLHFSPSISSRIISFLQTEFSKEVMAPVSYIFSKPDITHLPSKFKLFNINQVIVASHPIKEMFSESNEFYEVLRINNFSIFQFINYPNNYIEPVKFAPVLYTGKDWREAFIKWFKMANALEVPVVPADYISKNDLKYFNSKTDNILDLERFKKEIQMPANCKIEEKIDTFKIEFKTSCPGVPHLIKFSYFPNWKVKGADRIYPVTPCFMLVIPKGNEVVLTYGRTFEDYIGIISTIAGILFIILLPFIKKSNSSEDATYGTLSEHILETIFKIRVYIFLLLVISIAIASFYSIKNRNLPVNTYLKGTKLFNEQKYEMAIRLFEKITKDERYDLADTILCLLFEGRSYVKLKDYDKGIETFQRIINHYPYSRFVSEAYYEIGMANLFQNKKDEAREFFKKAVEVYRFSNYSDYAKDRLKEIEKTSDDSEMPLKLTPVELSTDKALIKSIQQGKKDKRIFIDLSHGKLDPNFKVLLRSWGYNPISPQSGFQNNKEKLFQSGILMMSYKVGGGEFTSKEMDTIRKFINSGGSLFLLCPVWVWNAYDHKPLELNPYHQIGKLYNLLLIGEYPKGRLISTRNVITPDMQIESQDWWGAFSRIIALNKQNISLFEDQDNKSFGMAAVLGESKLVLIGQDFLSKPLSYQKEINLKAYTVKLLDWLGKN